MLKPTDQFFCSFGWAHSFAHRPSHLKSPGGATAEFTSTKTPIGWTAATEAQAVAGGKYLGSRINGWVWDGSGFALKHSEAQILQHKTPYVRDILGLTESMLTWVVAECHGRVRALNFNCWMVYWRQLFRCQLPCSVSGKAMSNLVLDCSTLKVCISCKVSYHLQHVV